MLGFDYIDRIQDAVYAFEKDVLIVSPDDHVSDVARRLSASHRGIAVVYAQDGQALGVISERDIIRIVADNPKNFSALVVDQISTDRPETCSPNDDIRSVIGRMRKGGFRHMPVIENGVLIGLASLATLLSYLLSEADGEKKAFALAHLEYI